MTNRISIDWTRCDGHGLCSRLFGERIALDEWGFPLLDPRGVADTELAGARLAVRSCPRLALMLETDRVS
ncbi:ferredoxin [Nocardioides sp. BP30]|uniref:ferredoxin n=1 Tax=Nocardioides sp. BP30 TaxID=3036374 RepID=UPI00246926CD|nr:ferredoxin [Nocardioides sp. BP30]WGL51068.1 ferredoxin [Nocardioides sp. BP30]